MTSLHTTEQSWYCYKKSTSCYKDKTRKDHVQNKLSRQSSWGLFIWRREGSAKEMTYQEKKTKILECKYDCSSITFYLIDKHNYILICSVVFLFFYQTAIYGTRRNIYLKALIHFQLFSLTEYSWRSQGLVCYCVLIGVGKRPV